MTFSYIKILLMFLLISIIFTSCSESQEPVALVQPETEGYELPLEIWSTIKLQKLSMKYNSCVLTENGSPIEIGTIVLVLERANCDEVIWKPEPSITFRTGMVKVRVIDTGQEGWIWSSAANIMNSSNLNPGTNYSQ